MILETTVCNEVTYSGNVPEEQIPDIVRAWLSGVRVLLDSNEKRGAPVDFAGVSLVIRIGH